MERFCIITNRDKDKSMAVTARISGILRRAGRQVSIADVDRRADGSCYTRAKDIPEGTDCVVVLGGDGTLLQAAHDLSGRGIPIFGINLGTLGFLAETEVAEVEGAFEKLFAGKYEIREQMMLSTEVSVGGQESRLPDALNDLVVTRSGFSRVIGAGVYINGELVNDYRGDGVIIATPSGSTGYSLSAGGPIVSPTTNMMVITPICPHSLNARSIVVSDNDVVTVKIRMSKKTQDEEAIATVDGRTAINLRAGDYVKVCRAAQTTKLVRLSGGSFYQVLGTKLSGSYA